MKKLSWLSEINYVDLLSSDMKLIRERCGEEVLFSLLENVPRIHVYLSEAPLMQARKRYIQEHFRQGNAKEIATKLGVSEYFVYKTHKANVELKNNEQESLFPSS